jgi:MFS family permease
VIVFHRLRALPDARWNFWFFGLDIAFFTVALNISSVYTIMPLFVHQLTAQNWPVALITTIRMFGIYSPAMLSAGKAERLRRVKPTLLLLTIFERVPYLILALAVILLAHGNDIALLTIFFVMLLTMSTASGLCFPPWLDLISRTIPDRLRGRFLGGWTGTGNLLGLGGAAVATGLLIWLAWPWNFAACFLLSFFCVAISFVLLAMGREPERTERHHAVKVTEPAMAQGQRWLGDMWSVIHGDIAFRRFLIANAFSGMALLGSGLLAVAALRQAHLSKQTIGLETTVVLFAIMAGSIGWGIFGDHRGHRAILTWSSIAGTLAMVFALIAHEVVAMTLAFLLFGLGTAGMQLAQLTYVVEFGTPARRPVYIGLSFLLLAPFATIAPLIGGIMADQWGYTPAFLLAALLGVLATLAFGLWVRDPVPVDQAERATQSA